MRRSTAPLVVLGSTVAALAWIAACGATEDDKSGADGDGGAFEGGLFADTGPVVESTQPATCDEALKAKSYIGCDYWPTVLANNVWDVFDFAVVVANGQPSPAQVTVTGANGADRKVTVPANGLQKIFLPWVPALKGPDSDECGNAVPLLSSVKARKGAYHLISSLPVTVYQFNALEYQGEGGPTGKSWAACPGKRVCAEVQAPVGCYSFSNDASLLLPATAMTGNYRVTGQHGLGNASNGIGPYFAVTGTADGTTVTVQVAAGASILSGEGIPQPNASRILTFALDKGDVAEIIGARGEATDLSGSLVSADKPVQVLAGTPCSFGGAPAGQALPRNVTCDHLEESVFPAETLGRHYLVAPPTSPGGSVVGHEVRIYGNVDGTKLTYSPSKPAGCPAAIDAGQVVSCADQLADAFEVSADHEFAVGTFMLSGYYQDRSGAAHGDPSMSLATAVEQYRSKYLFLAPDDYDENWVDIIAPDGANVVVDGAPVAVSRTSVGSNGFGVFRQRLGPGKGGAHQLSADKPVGIQVMGFGLFTSYHYPGGLDLKSIAPPPPKPK